MQPEFLKELGLSPLWVRKSRLAAAVKAPPAAAPPLAAAARSPAAQAEGTSLPIEKMRWEQLREAVAGCRRCALCEKRKNPAFGSGDQQATIMFIGEGPGEEEDRRGEPFVGRAGQLLDLMLHAINLSRRHNVYIANIVKCRPPGNRNPQNSEAAQCMPYLRRQIELVQPAVLVALGKVAAAHLLNTEASIAQMRQKIHDYQNLPLVVTYHPAYLLRSPGEKRKSWEDLKLIRQLLAEQK